MDKECFYRVSSAKCEKIVLDIGLNNRHREVLKCRRFIFLKIPLKAINIWRMIIIYNSHKSMKALNKRTQMSGIDFSGYLIH